MLSEGYLSKKRGVILIAVEDVLKNLEKEAGSRSADAADAVFTGGSTADAWCGSSFGDTAFPVSGYKFLKVIQFPGRLFVLRSESPGTYGIFQLRPSQVCQGHRRPFLRIQAESPPLQRKVSR